MQNMSKASHTVDKGADARQRLLINYKTGRQNHY
jgi:hypothetical protein